MKDEPEKTREGKGAGGMVISSGSMTVSFDAAQAMCREKGLTVDEPPGVVRREFCAWVERGATSYITRSSRKGHSVSALPTVYLRVVEERDGGGVRYEIRWYPTTVVVTLVFPLAWAVLIIMEFVSGRFVQNLPGSAIAALLFGLAFVLLPGMLLARQRTVLSEIRTLRSVVSDGCHKANPDSTPRC